MTRHWQRIGAVIGAMALAVAAMRSVSAAPPTVFGAASLTDALQAVGRAYEDKTGEKVRFSFAASSRLAQQIAAGAPADIYAAANRQWMDHLAKRGLIAADSRAGLVTNSLVLIAPADSDVGKVDPTSGSAIADILGAHGRLAVGDPGHVPAGIYAKEALGNLGLWPRFQTRLAQTDDVRGALALVARGEAPLGIVYRTDARISEEVRIVGNFPAESHTPIAYPIAIVADRARPAVRRLFDFMTSNTALAIFRKYGFAAPADRGAH